MQPGEAVARPATAPARLHGLGFAVWAFAAAVGVLIHEWQRAQPATVLTAVEIVLAAGVLLRPWSVLRVVALLVSFALELAVDLPDVVNHVLIMGTVSVVVLIWWLLTMRRSPTDARDPGHLYGAIAPFLRFAFVFVLYAAAFAKLNTGFLDPVTTCSVWVLDNIPLLTIPKGLVGLTIAGAIIVEFAIPTLLLFRQTRILGIVVGIGFGVVTAAAGFAPFAGFGWSFYVLFIPPGTLGRVLVTVRRAIGTTAWRRLMDASSSPVAWIALAAALLLAMGFMQIAPRPFVALAKGYGATLVFCFWALFWVVLLLKNVRHWAHAPHPGGRTFGAGHPIFALALVLLVINAASPYLGLKTRFSFTMFSNLQTEPGRWNHVIVPEAFRIFGLQQGLVRFDDISDPDLEAEVEIYSGPRRWSSVATGSDSAWVVLAAAQRLASRYPNAIVRYELDGQARVASPVASDPILGASVPPLIQKLGGFRPVELEDACQL